MISALALNGSAYSEVDLAGGGIRMENISVEKSERTLFVKMDIDVSGLKVKSNQEVWMRPSLTSVDDTLRLPSVMLAGRNRYFQRRVMEWRRIRYCFTVPEIRR